MASSAEAQGAIDVTTVGDISYFVFQSESNHVLTTKSYGKSWSIPSIIGPARSSTPVASCFQGDKRTLFCLGDGNILRNYDFDDEDGEWTEGDLHSSKIVVHPNTGLAAVSDKDGVRLYFQTDSGDIQEVTRLDQGAWKTPSTISIAKPVMATAISASNGVSGVFYVHREDSSIHRSYQIAGQWKDAKIDNTNDVRMQAHIAVSTLEGNDKYSIKFVNTKGELVGVVGDAGEGRTNLGKVSQVGEVTPAAEAETKECWGGYNPYIIGFSFFGYYPRCYHGSYSCRPCGHSCDKDEGRPR